MAIFVQIPINTGESKCESSCAYYYLFLFSAWWFGPDCTDVALNGEYNTAFVWYNDAIGYVLPISSEMKIRQKQ